jgi:hypothetical protein
VDAKEWHTAYRVPPKRVIDITQPRIRPMPFKLRYKHYSSEKVLGDIYCLTAYTILINIIAHDTLSKLGRKSDVFQSYPSGNSGKGQDRAENDSVSYEIVMGILEAEKDIHVLRHGTNATDFIEATAVDFVLSQKLIKLTSKAGFHRAIILMKHSKDHTFVGIVCRANVVRYRIDPGYQKLWPSNKPSKEVVESDKHTAKYESSGS